MTTIHLPISRKFAVYSAIAHFWGLALLSTPALSNDVQSRQFDSYSQSELRPVSISSAKNEGKWYERSFEQLLDMEVYTATRESRTIRSAPSVVTVYTESDIERMGAQNIEQLLERTAGFYLGKQQAGPMIGSRGYIGDNEQFLLLIDGHNANSIVDKGPGYFFLFPNLDNVKRVEIIRGPGSTLWGSDAALGVIHIITKDGSDINGTTFNISAPFENVTDYNEDGYRYGSIQMGHKVAEDIEYMASLMFSASDGRPLSRPLAGDKGRWEQIHDSWELYAKAKLKEVIFRARISDFKNSRPNRSLADENQHPDASAFSRRRHSYLDIERMFTLTDDYSVELRVFSDLIERWQELAIPILTPRADQIEEGFLSREHGFGVEVINRFNYGDNHRFLFGFRGVRTEVDPVFSTANYSLNSEPSPVTSNVAFRVIPEQADVNTAVFYEHEWSIIPNILDMVYGVRFDKNNLREDNTIVLPRFALNWASTEHFGVMYAYNTGYIRPPVGLGFLGQRQPFYEVGFFGEVKSGWVYGIEDSERVRTHDLEFQFDYKPIVATLNLYQNTIEGASNFIFKNGVVDEENRRLFFVNTNRIRTYGYEFEIRAILNHGVEVYGNYSDVLYARVNSLNDTAAGIDFDYVEIEGLPFISLFTPNRSVPAIPHQTWNLGIDYSFSDTGVFNLHTRGWSGLTQKDITKRYRTYRSDYLVDLNVSFKKIAGLPFSTSFYVKNLLDNDDTEIPQHLFSNIWREEGRTFGVHLSYHLD